MLFLGNRQYPLISWADCRVCRRVIAVMIAQKMMTDEGVPCCLPNCIRARWTRLMPSITEKEAEKKALHQAHSHVIYPTKANTQQQQKRIDTQFHKFGGEIQTYTCGN